MGGKLKELKNQKIFNSSSNKEEKCYKNNNKIHQQQPLNQNDFNLMERGHRVCKLIALKKFDIIYFRLWLNTQTQQIVLSKWNNNFNHTNSSCSSLDINCSSSSTLEEQIEINSRSYSTTIPPKYSTATTSTRSCSSTSSFSSLKTQTLDLRLIKDVQVLSQIGTTMQITEKWRRDSALQRFDKNTVLCISWGVTFIPNNWLILFDNKELCNLWCQGLRQLCLEQANASQALIVERWLRKQFCSLLVHPTDNACISIKHMKPFVQQRLQCKISGKQLQEIIENEMGFESFVFAHNWLLNFHSLFMSMFSDFVHPQNEQKMPFRKFVDFLKNVQNDELGKSPELASDYLRRYFRDVDPDRDIAEPWLSTSEFVDYLFSCDNSLFDPLNKEVVHDMTKPLTHYWISSSHNTYLTGDQLKSESSLDAYARSLLLGCRCVELDCWDGPQRRGPNGETIIDIVIYHGYTMTSKLALKDVLQTIKHYAFQTSDYPLILSIEDNCSVPAQRQMAIDIQEVLGDLLLTSPISRDEWELPSPCALRNKIILKHKKLREEQQENDNLNNNSFLLEDELDQDILSRQCIKKGVLWLKNDVSNGNNNGGIESIWRKHIFVLFHDRLCYLIQPIDDENKINNKLNNVIREKSFGSQNDENFNGDELEENNGGNSGHRNSITSTTTTVLVEDCSNCHITEEWFHGKIDREEAKERLIKNKINGTFLVRESNTFIGDFTLSFLFNNEVHHCRIKTNILPGGEKRYHLLDTLKKESLYELISYYMKHSLNTPNFKTYLLTPCPQPQPHLDQQWFCLNCDTQKAEELLTKFGEDGGFLIRYSKNDTDSFVLSLRVDSINWHLRLKREGRVFVVGNQIFENLCQLVEYFGKIQFFRGICLKYPVNEETVKNKNTKENLNSLKEEEDNQIDGCYVELNDLKNEFQVEAIESFEEVQFIEDLMLKDYFKEGIPYNGKALCFPLGAKITVLQKYFLNKNEEQKEIDKWLYLGRYNNEIGWFPPCSVNEEVSDREERPYSFKISLTQSHWKVRVYIVATDNEEELKEWLLICQQQSRQANDKIQQLRNRERQLRIASQLSCLVVYCQAVPFNPDFKLQDQRNSFFEMCSFSESKHDKLIEKGLPLFNQRQLSRVYPQASRLTSTNFNPIPMWNSGCHMVALNFQTGDKPMQLNFGRFNANGRCGYVLKPQYLMDETFWQKQQNELFNQKLDGVKKKLLCRFCRNKSKIPLNKEKENGDLQKCCCDKINLDFDENLEEKQKENNLNGIINNKVNNNSSTLFTSNRPIILIITIIAGRHLTRKSGYDKGGICSPYVEIELLGFGNDSQIQKTNTICSNGLSPVWQERFYFKIKYPEMGLLRFFVEDGDFVGPKTDPFIGQAIFPIDCIRPGFRSISLLNQFNEPLELSALLVHVEIREWKHLNTITTTKCRSNSLLVTGNSLNFSSKISSSSFSDGSNLNNNLMDENPPISNIHQYLQFGRSILADSAQEQLNENNNSLEFSGMISTKELRQTNNLAEDYTFRNPTPISPPNNNRNSALRNGSSTLRKLFRLGRNSNN
ncbi:unnamed protein product [Meloidogyne enterolobii]|uniref:Uncharacterized protein n=1 Tax=Meloidogyne enterolobii TaxID=390850 RepID=A0ACB0Y7L3_MELEN